MSLCPAGLAHDKQTPVTEFNIWHHVRTIKQNKTKNKSLKHVCNLSEGGSLGFIGLIAKANRWVEDPSKRLYHKYKQTNKQKPLSVLKGIWLRPLVANCMSTYIYKYSHTHTWKDVPLNINTHIDTCKSTVKHTKWGERWLNMNSACYSIIKDWVNILNTHEKSLV